MFFLGSVQMKFFFLCFFEDQVSQCQRLFSYRGYSDFLDYFQPRLSRIQRGDRRSPGHEPVTALSELHILSKEERLFVRKPAGEMGLKPFSKLRPDIEKGVSRSTTEPFQTASDIKINTEILDIHWNRSRSMIPVDESQGSSLTGSGSDLLDILDVRRFEVDMRSGNQKSFIINGIDNSFRL